MNHEQVIAALNSRLGHMLQNLTVKNRRRIYIDVEPEHLVEVAGAVHREFGARFSIATGIDMATHFEVLYHFAFEDEPPLGFFVSVRVRLDHDRPSVDSITAVVPAAEWIEREMAELLGIEFRNHPDPRRLLLSEDWPEGVHPLRRGRPWEGKIEKTL